MGHFLAVSAIRSEDEGHVQNAIIQYCASHGVKCNLRENIEQTSPERDAQVYASHNGWIRVLWPEYFNIHDFPLCEQLSKEMSVAVSTIHVYDDDFWEQLFVSSGEILHRFSSWPDYFAESAEDAAEARKQWKGDPTQLVSFLGIPEDTISRYLVHLPLEPQQPRPAERRGLLGWFKKAQPVEPTPVKAYDSDEFPLDFFWVFVDFWNKLGITYPDPPDSLSSALRLDRRFGAKLPSI